MKKLNLIFSVALVTFLVGCTTTNTLYDWGDYGEDLYEYYHDPVKAKEFPAKLEAHLAQVEQSGQKPAPGLYAEVGTFNLKIGDIPKAISFYKKEAKAWPEGAALMNVMIQNLKKQTSKGSD